MGWPRDTSLLIDAYWTATVTLLRTCSKRCDLIFKAFCDPRYSDHADTEPEIKVNPISVDTATVINENIAHEMNPTTAYLYNRVRTINFSIQLLEAHILERQGHPARKHALLP